MKFFLSNLLKMRKGKLVCITVCDGFTGFVKILKNRYLKWYVEIVDVSMCYPSQKQLQPGERMWLTHGDLYKEEKVKKQKYKKHYNDNELPF